MSNLPDTASPLPSGSGLGAVAFLRTHTIVVLLLLLAAFILAIEVSRPGTVNPNWASNIVMFAAPLGIMAAGQTLVMLTGGIDLSVASVASCSAYLMATHYALGGLPAVAFGLAVGVAIGSINGVGISLLGVQPLIMTLGTGLMTEGALVVYSQTRIGQGASVPEFIHSLGAGKVLEVIPNDLFLWAPLAVAIILMLRQTGFGRLLYAVGDNSQACRMAGIRVWRVLFVNYLICGLLAAVSGLVMAGSAGFADMSLADVFLLPSIAAAIIGGTSIFGGRGGYAGTIVGVLILTVLNSILTLLDAPEPVRQILYGAIILMLATAYTRIIG